MASCMGISCFGVVSKKKKKKKHLSREARKQSSQEQTRQGDEEQRLYKVDHPQVELDSTRESIESGPENEENLKDLHVTPPKEYEVQSTQEDKSQPDEFSAVDIPWVSSKSSRSSKKRAKRAVSAPSISCVPLTMEPSFKHPSRRKVQKSTKPPGKSGSKPTSRVIAKQRSQSAKSVPAHPSKAWDNGEVEDESASAKTFFLTLQKSSEPRLAWMERTLGKGLNYHVRKFKANRNYKAPNFSTIVCDSNGNKNRYDDIKCIDDTRVVLRETTSGYINANYIISLSGRKYICTQAPMDTTMADFWKMVIQEKCRMIVMLCSEIEDGKSKCTSYYPARVGDKVTFGKTTITSLTQSISAQFGYTLSICDVQTGPNRFKLRHIHCVSWPDHSAPQNAKCAIEIHRILVKNRLSRAVVIHCSAGIGRTCTLVGAELLLERIQLRRNPSAVSVLRLMRRCRMGAVQVSVQYVFMLLILLELFCEEGVMKESDPRMKEFREKYAKVLRLYNRKLEKQRLKEREENQQAANRITKVTETTTKQTVTKG